MYTSIVRPYALEPTRELTEVEVENKIQPPARQQKRRKEPPGIWEYFEDERSAKDNRSERYQTTVSKNRLRECSCHQGSSYRRNAHELGK